MPRTPIRLLSGASLPEGCQYSDSSCCTRVLVDQSAQKVSPTELKARCSLVQFGSRAPRRRQAQTAMREGCQYSDSSCCTLVLVDQSAQKVSLTELKATRPLVWFGSRALRLRQIQATVRSLCVVVLGVDA